MIAYDKALQIIKEAALPLPVVYFPMGEALGFVLAQDLRASIHQPPFDRSALDGYAFHAQDTESAKAASAVSLQVTETIPAGFVSNTSLKSGTAVRIFTGAMLPPGADAVIAQEDLAGSTEGHILVNQSFLPGQNVALMGEDIFQGDLLLPTGCQLGPSELGLLATQGISEVPVYRKPNVTLLCSGSELLDVDEPLEPGKIYNSNRYLVENLTRLAGGTLNHFQKTSDDLPLLVTHLTEALAIADVVITTGGVSVGDYDLIPAAIKQAGAEILFHRVAMKPGTPFLAAKAGTKLIFGLSGNPAACLVGFVQFILPALQILQGNATYSHVWIESTLTKPINKTGKQNRFIAAVTKFKDGGFYSTPITKQKSGNLAFFRETNSLLFIPTNVGTLATGDSVKVQLLPEIFGNTSLFSS